MDEKRNPIPVGILVLYAAMLAAMFAPLAIKFPVIGAVAGSAIGAIFIVCVVRWVNRRDSD
jgi:membrane associated rhomboid family serine protease